MFGPRSLSTNVALSPLFLHDSGAVSFGKTVGQCQRVERGGSTLQPPANPRGHAPFTSDGTVDWQTQSRTQVHPFATTVCAVESTASSCVSIIACHGAH
jgi:hypothetical protein